MATKVAREFARNAEVIGRALDDLHGRRDQSLVPLRRDLPRIHRDARHVRLRRHQRRRLGALRRPGEDPHVRRLAGDRGRPGLAAPAAPGPGNVVVLRRTPSSGATTAFAWSSSPARWRAGCSTAQPRSTLHAKAVRLGWMPGAARRSSATRSTSPTRRGGRRRPGGARRRRAQGRAPALRDRRPRARRRTGRACSSCGARTCWGRRARARSTSCATFSAPRRTRYGRRADRRQPA